MNQINNESGKCFIVLDKNKTITVTDNNKKEQHLRIEQWHQKYYQDTSHQKKKKKKPSGLECPPHPLISSFESLPSYFSFWPFTMLGFKAPSSVSHNGHAPFVKMVLRANTKSCPSPFPDIFIP